MRAPQLDYRLLRPLIGLFVVLGLLALDAFKQWTRSELQRYPARAIDLRDPATLIQNG